MSRNIKHGCAMIDAGAERGTGYLVAPDTAVTCEHVVRPAGLKGQVKLIFDQLDPPGSVAATVEAWDPTCDWAVLKLAAPVPGTTPLRLATGCKKGDPWEAWGFPAALGRAGIWVRGEVHDSDAKDPRGQKSIELFSAQVSAGQGAPMGGFSGTPVLVNEEVIGHLKAIVPDDSFVPRAEFGLVYATPLGLFEAGLPRAASTPRPPLAPPRGIFDARWYVPRSEAERLAGEYLNQPGRPVVLWGTELSGKTWFMQNLLAPIEKEEGSRVVRVSLDMLDPEAWASLDRMLYSLAWQIGDALGLDESGLEAAWKVPGAKNRMRRYMARTALPAASKRLVLAIDQADTILRRSKDNSGDEFFGMLRGWASDASDPWTRLRLMLAVSATPSNLTNDIHQSPFNNLSDPIRLLSLSAVQAQALADLHDLKWNPEQLQKLMDLVGGHPYLLRRAMYESAGAGTTLDDLLDPKTAKGRLFDDFLEDYRRHLGTTGETLRKLKSGAPLGPVDREPVLLLERTGLATKDDTGRYRIACRLFERLLEA